MRKTSILKMCIRFQAVQALSQDFPSPLSSASTVLCYVIYLPLALSCATIRFLRSYICKDEREREEKIFMRKALD